MPHPLLDETAIANTAEDHLRRTGRIFAEFGARTQDSGNVSYGVEVDGGRYFVKTAGDPHDSKPFLSHAERVALLRNAARLARSCDHPALPRLYNLIESATGPMLVYEWLDGELLGAPKAIREDPNSAFQRFRRLPAEQILSCLDVVYELHRELARCGWITVDFYDGSLIYDFAAGRLRVVDLDNYHPGPFQNTMGRMFGSTRFMAPEEFERGRTIDERTTVFVMGRTAAVLLSDGTFDPKRFRGSEAVRAVASQACESEPDRRFQSMEAFYDAWRGAKQARSNQVGKLSIPE